MGLADLTRDSVLQAIAEHDSLGREAFLDKYGFGKSTRYLLEHDGSSYDSKAIAGAAHAYATPSEGALQSTDFSGGVSTVVRTLADLGFTVSGDEGSAAGSQPAFFMFTAAAPLARQHLERSLRQGVELELLQPLHEIADELRAHEQHGRVYGWGAKPGGNAEKKWERLRVGDQGLVYSEGRFLLSIEVIAKAGSEDVARSVWGDDADGGTWSCMTFLDPVNEVDVSLQQVREALGYSWNYIPQGFEIPGKEAQQRLIERYGSVEAAIAEMTGARPEGQHVWWVNQGASFRRAREGGYLWAPKTDKANRTHPDWDSLSRARAGDLVLNYANGELRSVSTVIAEAFDADRPDPEQDQEWSNEGRRLSVEYRDLDNSIPLTEVPSTWRVDETGGPFDRTGAVKQGYFFPLTQAFVGKMADRFPELGLTSSRPAAQPLTAAAVREVAESPPHRLRLEDELYETVVAALNSGKHIILTGPPGTAKTTLAQALAETADGLGRSNGFVLTTATADWTTYETIGGLQPTTDQRLEFRPGHFLDAISSRSWLVIDELNRSQFDRAFGQLFTVLSGQPVTLPYARPGGASRIKLVPADHPAPDDADTIRIQESWRLIGTMNVFDKSLLFEMSYALMRRFAFIEVPSPSVSTFEALIAEWADGEPRAEAVAEDLMRVRAVKDVGPAVFRDIARFARERFRQEAPVNDSELRFQAFYSYLLPQFEGVTDEDGERLQTILLEIVGSSQAWRERVRATLNQVLGLELARPAQQGGSPDEPGESPPSS